MLVSIPPKKITPKKHGEDLWKTIPPKAAADPYGPGARRRLGSGDHLVSFT